MENIVGLAQQGIKAYLPTPELSQRNEFYPAQDFQYNQLTKIIWIKQRHIEPPKPTRELCASGWSGWNHYSGKPSNGITW